MRAGFGLRFETRKSLTASIDREGSLSSEKTPDVSCLTFQSVLLRVPEHHPTDWSNTKLWLTVPPVADIENAHGEGPAVAAWVCKQRFASANTLRRSMRESEVKRNRLSAAAYLSLQRLITDAY